MDEMRNTSLCYIERGNEYLLLHRVKKEADENRDKWIGVGGKFEEGESPEDCMLREVYEETGLCLSSWRFRAVVTFVSDQWDTEYMHLFTADSFSGRLKAVTRVNWNGWTGTDSWNFPSGKGTKFSFACSGKTRPFSLLSSPITATGL